MGKEIFREKSLNRLQSPDDLNDYIRVSNPGVWLLLAAVAVLLVGACVWGIFGHIDTTVKVQAYVENGTVTCDVSDAQVEQGMIMRINGTECTVSDVSYNGQDGAVLCTVTAQTDIPDGEYTAEIVLESIRPFSFVLN